VSKKWRILLFWAVVLLAAVVVFLAKGWWVLDHSGQTRGEGLVWKGVTYIPGSGAYSEGKTIAKTRDGWHINRVEEDPSHTFLVLRSFLEQWLVVREDYRIPTSGEITAVHWKRKQITDPLLLQTVTQMLAEAEPEIYYETDHIFRLSDDQDTSLLRAAYEGCPIATEDIGHLGVVDGQWIFATDIQTTSFRANGEPEQYLVSCYIIPDEQATILERYLQ